MSDSAYLIDHPPARRQYRSSRRAEPSGVIVCHTAENATDLDDEDTGAEAVARFIAGRTDAAGSYHQLGDRDSIIQLVPFSYEAFHDGTGSNRHSIGISLAMRASAWPLLDQADRDAYVATMARMARNAADWLAAEHGIAVPVTHLTRAQSDARKPGFIGHGERDPGRRSDPGSGFPWRQFLDTYARLPPAATQLRGPVVPDRRDNITRWQTELIKRGQDLGPSGADGDFGDLTERGSFEQFAHLDYALAQANERVGHLEAEVARLTGQIQAVGVFDPVEVAAGRLTMNWIRGLRELDAGA